MPIHPLPQFEADLKEYLQEQADREAYEKLNAPSTIVVRFGYMRMIGEFPYSGDSKPGCGSKLVVQTMRGTEIGEMLTSTCANSGCSKSVTRKEMLEYIENSGGRQYPFFDRGRVIRIATVDDLNTQSKLEQRKNEIRMIAKRMVERAGLEMTIIEAELIFGNERVIIYFGAEDRVDFRDLVQDLGREIGTKVELRQIGARDEARITADYERCGQYCCCKSFLKVLKPVSMKSAKIQKATLDPLKISGRCGRLMCCLRYEDETYDELRKNLPHRKTRVGTPEGDGIVINTQILTQLAMVRLDNNTDVAIPIEELSEPEFKTAPEPATRGGRSSRSASTKRGESRDESRSESRSEAGVRSGKGSGKRKRTKSKEQAGVSGEGVEAKAQAPVAGLTGPTGSSQDGDRPKKKKRRRRRRSGSGGEGSASTNGTQDIQAPSENKGSGSGDGRNDVQSDFQSGSQTEASGGVGGGAGPKKKRRRRRRRSGGEGGSASNGESTGGSTGGSSGGSGDGSGSGTD